MTSTTKPVKIHTVVLTERAEDYHRWLMDNRRTAAEVRWGRTVDGLAGIEYAVFIRTGEWGWLFVNPVFVRLFDSIRARTIAHMQGLGSQEGT